MLARSIPILFARPFGVVYQDGQNFFIITYDSFFYVNNDGFFLVS